MDLVIFVTATLAALLAVSYSMMVDRLDEIKENWAKYRCNPVYMPFASFVGVDTVGNFTKCTMKSFQDYAGFILDPIQRLFGTFLAMFSSIAKSLESMRQMFAGVRKGFLGITTMIFGKLANTLSAMRYLMIRIRTVFMRVVAVMAAMMNIMNAGIGSGRSVMNGPIGRTINFLCFAPETQVALANGSVLPLCHIRVGDILKDGDVVTRTYMLIGDQQVPLYAYRGVLVTGSHRLADGTKIEDCSEARLVPSRTVLCCLDTSSGLMTIGGVRFRDFEWGSPENPLRAIPLEDLPFIPHQYIVGTRVCGGDIWEVLVL